MNGIYKQYFYSKTEARRDFLLYDYDLSGLPYTNFGNECCYARPVLLERFEQKYLHPGYDTHKAIKLLKQNRNTGDFNKLINKTTAKFEYFLPNSVLEKIPHIVMKRSKFDQFTKLYDQAVLMKAVKKTYGVNDPNEIIPSLKLKREKRIAARKANAKKRLEQH